MSPAKRLETFRLLCGEIYVSQCGVAQQARRLSAGGQPAAEYMADGRMLILAAQDTYRAARGCLDLVAAKDRAHVQGALDAFDAELPQLKQARHALQHADEYLIGAARNPTRVGQKFARGGHAVEVVVGTVSVNVELADAATTRLASDVVVGVELRRNRRGVRTWL
jgi:hypothetical protein